MRIGGYFIVVRFLTCVQELMSDSLKPFVPLFYKEIFIEGAPGAPPEAYLEIQDLLGNFQNPSVMDVKMVRIEMSILCYWDVYV